MKERVTIVTLLAMALTCALTLSAMAAETVYYRDAKVGIFKVTLKRSEIGKHPVKSIVPVYDPAVLTEVYAYDSRSAKRDDVADGDDAETKEKKRKKAGELEKKRGEMYRESSDLREDNSFNEKYLARVKKGELKATAAETKAIEVKIEKNKAKLREIEERMKPLSKEIEELYSDIYSYGRHRVSKKELSNEASFAVTGRFLKSGPTEFRLVNAESGETVTTVALTLPDREVRTDRAVLEQWLDVQRNHFRKIRGGSADGVFAYVAGQSERRFSDSTAEVKAGRAGMRDWFTTGTNPDLYSMASGMLAIQEALQFDRMQNPSSEKDRYDAVKVESLQGPAIKSHPFEIMLGGKTPAGYPIDALVPADFYYLHFSNIRDQIALSELMDQWGTNFLHLMQVSSTDGRMKEKYLGQLCLEVSELTKLFGDRVIDDMAICGSDPFLEDGTDLSVIFSIKNRAVFDLNAAKNFAAAKGARKDASESSFDIGKYRVRAVTTPDGAVSSYSFYIGDFMVYSNSKAAAERIVDAFENQRRAMAKADDYLYMRTVYEAGTTSESAFLYLSDAHIRKLVGPEWKIGRQRRLNCAASLRMINNAVTLYRMDKKADRPSLEALEAGGYFEKGYAFCPDGGTYSIDPENMEPCCSKHRRLRYLTPIAEMRPLTASKTEAEQFERFVREYNNYWTKFFDPVGIRIRNSEKSISLETCILPLVENTIYNGLLAACGGRGVKFPDLRVPGTIFSLRGKVNLKDDANARFFEHMVAGTSFTADRFYKFIGQGFTFNLLDSDIRFTLDPVTARLLSLGSRDSFGVAISFILSALNHPLFVTLDVTDMKEAETFLIELFKFIEEENASRTRGFIATDFGVYRVRPDDKGTVIYSINYKLFIIGINIHMMVHDGRLIIATKRSILTDILKNSSQAGPGTDESNFEFEIDSANFDQISKTYNIIWGEKMREACHSNLWPIYVLNRLRGVSMDGVKAASLLVNGYYPYCPAGGEYFFDDARGLVSCRLHGNAYDPRQPLDLDANSELVKFFKSLKKVKASLSFTVHGIMTRVLIER